ncbi:hydroxypyruvate isomerase [Echinicola strongylocentroti]|uniref:Hydroxypyruvate isomerase n=1 Tax=Echinicola strongylocentroti TaxID=1795355 RepID=A0A2Z4IK69_9BACT|nr:TIM barrel protein [Echinicola strongylocentroti]AWW31364.1 hydroxypyruvate isomerase [Echinicola strongylocentroti]
MSERRSALKKMVLGTAALSGMPYLNLKANNKQNMLKGNINHSVCRWTYGHLSLDELCVLIKDIGFSAIDLLGPNDWPTAQKHGVYSSMCNGAEISLEEGFNHTEYHDTLIKNYSEMIPLVAKNGYKNLICFSGNRNGMDEETGLQNSVKGLQKLLPLAEKHGVTLTMELLNSKVNHPDYMCDKSVWGVELCKRLDNENFNLLYDIYHMQIDEGDVIRTIGENHQYYGHYHTAGNPGRNEIDDTQELNYPAIIKAIAKTGFKGYIAQEFIPKADDKAASLREAIALCDI